MTTICLRKSPHRKQTGFFLIRLKWSWSSGYFQYVGIDYDNVGYEIRKGTKHSTFGSWQNYSRIKYMYPL